MSNLNGVTAWLKSTRSRRRRRRGLEARELQVLVGAAGALGADADGLVAMMPIQMGRLATVYLRGQQVLEGADLAYLKTSVEDAVRSAAAASRRSIRHSHSHPCLNTATALTTRVDEMASFLSRREGEISRRRYAQDLSRGVLLSLLLLAGMGLLGHAVIKTWVWMQGDHSFPASKVPGYDLLALRDTLVTVGGGAAGAAVSVLLRLKRSPDLNLETINSGAACYRLVLGWFFAAAILFLVKGGMAANLLTDPSAALLTERTPAVVVSSGFFWGGIGFLAGFNERWATNIVSRDPKSPFEVPTTQTLSTATPTQTGATVQYVVPTPTFVNGSPTPVSHSSAKREAVNGDRASLAGATPLPQ